MNKDTIAADVSDDETNLESDELNNEELSTDLENEEENLSPRERLMRDVVARSEEERGIKREEDDEDDDDPQPGEDDDDNEDLEPGPDDEELEDDDLDPNPDDGLDDEPEAKTDVDSVIDSLGYYKNDKGEIVTKIQVQGIEREVTADALKNFVQKDLAGDLKLKEVSQERIKLERDVEEFNARKDALIDEERKTQLEKATNQPSAQDVEELRATASGIVESLIQGEEELATESLMKVLARPQTTLDTQEIASQAATVVMNEVNNRESQRLTDEWKDSQNQGNLELKESYPEIYADDVLFKSVGSKTQDMVELRRAGDPDFINMTPRDMIMSAAKEVDTWAKERMAKPGSGKQVSRKVDKSKLKRIPSGNSAVRTVQKKPVKDLTPAGVVDRMKAQRAKR